MEHCLIAFLRQCWRGTPEMSSKDCIALMAAIRARAGHRSWRMERHHRASHRLICSSSFSTIPLWCARSAYAGDVGQASQSGGLWIPYYDSAELSACLLAPYVCNGAGGMSAMLVPSEETAIRFVCFCIASRDEKARPRNGGVRCARARAIALSMPWSGTDSHGRDAGKRPARADRQRSASQESTQMYRR